MPSARLYPVAFITASPEIQTMGDCTVAVPALGVLAQAGPLNSSAPISGLVTSRVLPSISVVMPAMGVAIWFSGLVAVFRCRLDATLINWGSTARELTSLPVRVRQVASVAALVVPLRPTLFVAK